MDKLELDLASKCLLDDPHEVKAYCGRSAGLLFRWVAPSCKNLGYFPRSSPSGRRLRWAAARL
eukprot:1227994-Lingulodinium_polyedra.AAC.1